MPDSFSPCKLPISDLALLIYNTPPQASHGQRTLFYNLQDFSGSNMPYVSQILFVLGLTLIIGPQKTLLFFARRQKLKGTAAFAAGILLILFRWPFVGFLVELYGIFVLFGDFLGTIGGFVTNAPVVGPYIGTVLEKIGASRRNAELPV